MHIIAVKTVTNLRETALIPNSDDNIKYSLNHNPAA